MCVVYESDHLKSKFSMEWRNCLACMSSLSVLRLTLIVFTLLSVLCICLSLCFIVRVFKLSFVNDLSPEPNWNLNRNTIATIFVVVIFGSTTKPSFWNRRLWNLAPFFYYYYYVFERPTYKFCPKPHIQIPSNRRIPCDCFFH